MAAKSKPVYLLAGGRSSIARRGPDPLIQEALRVAAAVKPSIAYVGAASGDNAMFRAMITRVLRKAGAGEVRLVPLCGRRADLPKAMRVIEDCHIVFISGGDVEAGMKVLVEKGMMDFLRDQSWEGKPFFGVSAGSIMLAKNWVRWSDSQADSSAELFPCLGLAQVHCDTHDEGNDWEELRVLARLVPAGSVCYGITSGAALAAYPDGSVQAFGGEIHCFKQTGKVVTQIENLKPR